jgi:hypothetical protein
MKMERTEYSETSAYKTQTPNLYLPAYEDGTECAEKSVYKTQTPNIHLPAYEDGTDRVFRNVGI